MTILTKSSLTVKVPIDGKSPLVDDGLSDVEDPNACPLHSDRPLSPGARRGSNLGFLLLVFFIVMLSLSAVVWCVAMNNEHSRAATTLRFQGFCSIPIDRDEPAKEPLSDQLIEPYARSHRVMPLQWTASPDVQVFSGDEGAASAFVNSLREQFDIGGRVEKIQVFDNGRVVSFIHDFDDNVTGIVDQDRCFSMELDPSLVLAPELMVLSIEGGAEWDVSRVRSTLRAALPALAGVGAALRERCHLKPVYKLERSDPVVRKRSVDAPPHDYIHFAGKHVHEIQIANLGDILTHEKTI